MRVIAGTAKSIYLETIEGDGTRPTSDRIKETLFNIIQFDLADSIFLDLFSGSGSIGIEALSRGAKQAYFVDNNPKAIKCIKSNLKRTKLDDKSKVLNSDALAAISRLNIHDNKFDLIFIDPPYNSLYEKDTLEAISKTNLLHDDSIIIVEAGLKTTFDYLDNSPLEVYREKEYKNNKHVFIRKASKENA